jgi:glycosyltransferase involved in cell wall biosynthesis
MRIAMLATELDPQRPAGGAARYALAMATELRRRGHQLEVFCYPGPTMPDVLRLDPGWLRDVPVARACAWSWRVRRWLRQAQVVLVNYPLLGRGLLAPRWRKPTVVVVHSTMRGLGLAAGNSVVGRLEGLVRSIGARLERPVLRQATRVVCVATHLAAEVAREERIPAERLAVVANGVDTQYFIPAHFPTRGAPRLLAVGRLIALKRFELAIEALAGLHAAGIMAQLELAGDGPLRDALAQLAAARGVADAVTFHGQLDNDALRRAYQRCQALLLLSRHEGESLVALEGLACAIPLVAAPFHGADLLVGHEERGWLLTEEELAAAPLATKLAAVLAAPDTARQRGLAGRIWVIAARSWQRCAQRLELELQAAFTLGR